MSPPTIPDGYTGRILEADYSSELHQNLARQITDCAAFDKLGLSVMPYIAAWRTDQSGIWYEFVSDRFLELFDCSPHDIARTFCNSIVDHRQYQRTDIYPDIEEKVLNKDALENQRLRLRRKTVSEGVGEGIYKVALPNGRFVWLKDWASVTYFEEDAICLSPGYLCNVSLVMNQKDYLGERSETVTREKDLLVEAERYAALGQISAKIFHEIRNPILSIGGLAKRLLKKPDSTHSLKYLEVIAKETTRLEKVLANLFDYTSNTDFSPEPTDFVKLVKNVIDLLQSDLDRQQIAITLTASDQIRPIMIDREQLSVALVHILKNSIEAMQHGGKITITLYQHPGKTTLSIRDSGPGIPAGYARRVTEPFFTTKVYGTGLGLSLAQKAIDLHKGSLTFRQPDNAGTEVVMELPMSNI